MSKEANRITALEAAVANLSGAISAMGNQIIELSTRCGVMEAAIASKASPEAISALQSQIKAVVEDVAGWAVVVDGKADREAIHNLSARVEDLAVEV